jgi:mRNA-degrading endonuclease RelE of RelBE toxin-antitoxin system
MNVTIRSSFEKAVKKLTPRLQKEVAEIISTIENSKNPREIPQAETADEKQTAEYSNVQPL